MPEREPTPKAEEMTKKTTRKTTAKKTATKARAPRKGEVSVRELKLPKTPISTARVRIYGPRLVVHNWAEKSRI